jgi:hypothetical protein
MKDDQIANGETTMRSLLSLTATAALGLLGACSSGPAIRADAAPGVDLSAYRTFGFLAPLATDGAGYSTLLTARLKDATRRELEARGITFAESGAQALVNFNVNVQQRTDVQSAPGSGYYGYRRGMYVGWSGYPYDVETIHYDVGTLAIDVVDAAKKQLVWQGTAEGRISDSAKENPGPAIDNVVAEIFVLFPVPPKAAVPPKTPPK